jgi:hypothetical protein
MPGFLTGERTLLVLPRALLQRNLRVRLRLRLRRSLSETYRTIAAAPSAS